MIQQICPILAAQTRKDVQIVAPVNACAGYECAWYVPEKASCAIKVLALKK
jgi:hypothetical protein